VGYESAHVQVVVGIRVGLIQRDDETSVRGRDSTRIVPGREKRGELEETE